MQVILNSNSPKQKQTSQFGMSLIIDPYARDIIKATASSKKQILSIRSLYKKAPKHFNVIVSKDPVFDAFLSAEISDNRKHAYKKNIQGVFQGPIKWIKKQIKIAQKLEDKYYKAK